MPRELKAEILKWLMDNENTFNRVVECYHEFKPYIFNPAGEYLIGGKVVADFIDAADNLLYR